MYKKHIDPFYKVRAELLIADIKDSKLLYVTKIDQDTVRIIYKVGDDPTWHVQLIAA